MKIKKIISVILIFAFVFAFAPYNTKAAGTEDVVVKVLVEPSLDYDWVSNFNEGLAAVCKDDKWGYIDTTGKLVIPCQYDYHVDPFKYGVAIVRIRKENNYYDYYFGVIDKTGKLVLPIEYDYIWNFYDGLAEAGKDGKKGVVNTAGKIVIPFIYEDINSHGYIDGFPQGYVFSDGLAAVKKGDKWGYIDKTNKTVIPFKYDYAQPFGEGLAAVSINGKNSYIDKNGKIIINCSGYTPIEPFSEGLALVTGKGNPMGGGGEFGYIDKTGKFAISFERYSSASSFQNGYAMVFPGNYSPSGVIDKTGKYYSDPPPKYNADGLAIVNTGRGIADFEAGIFLW